MRGGVGGGSVFASLQSCARGREQSAEAKEKGSTTKEHGWKNQRINKRAHPFLIVQIVKFHSDGSIFRCSGRCCGA